MSVAAAIAALPILVALILLVGLRWPAARAMPICAAVTALGAYFLWQVAALRIAAATVEALWITASILLIVFGALFFLALLRQTGAISVLQQSLGALSADARIQAVLVGWILGSFLEGAAGFGAPAAITAPLLIGLGFRPLQAVVVALVGDSTAVSFGVVGTPMIIGMGEGLADAEAPPIGKIAQQIARYDLVLGTLMPAILVFALTLSARGRAGWSLGKRAAPFALCVGLVQAVTSWAVVETLGPEFPSLIGPMAGFLAALLFIRTGWLIPRATWRIAPVAEEPTETIPDPAHPDVRNPSPALAFAPYLLLLVVLVLTRIRVLPLHAWLKELSFGVENLFGTGINADIAPLYSPGSIFVLCTLASALWLRAGTAGIKTAAKNAGGVTLKTAVALVAAITTVRIFIRSGENAADLDAMPLVLAEALAAGLDDAWPVVAPWVGALGSFIAGSATFSNMLFALLQFQVASDLAQPATEILALQGVGAAAGNMVCIHNVVAACAVAGILGQEGNVIRRTAIPMTIYLVIAGALALVL